MTSTPPPTAGRLRAALEAVVLAVVTLSPWAFAAVHPLPLFAVYCGVAAALLLWAGVLLVERRAPGTCPVVLGLVGMLAVGVVQLVPLPAGVLNALSPATAALRADLVPADLEAVRGDPPAPAPAPTLTLDPGATRAVLVKLLAVTALFAVVRYGVASPAAFRRLAVVGTANGSALALVALAQKFSSPPGTIYWHFVSQGQPFGPFICRNHFPFYVNVCFGLGVGLLLSGRPFRHRSAGDIVADLGRHPGALWVAAALGLMLAADLLSLSRGGAVALAGGAAVFAAVLVATTRRAGGGLATVGVVAVLGVGLVGWLGAGAVGDRLDTLGDGRAADGGRLTVWGRVLPLAGRYPLFGTGYGTFEAAEPPERRPGDEVDLSWDAAHNDYLEILIEGGFAQLGLLLTAAAVVYRAGVRAVRRSPRADGMVALGALFGLTTAAVHAFVDFGLHMPAIVALVVVVAAHLTAAGRASGGREPPGWPAEPGDPRPPLARSTPLAVAAVCLLVAVVLPYEGWRAAEAARYRRAAVRAAHRLPAGSREPAVEYLRAAVGWTPDDAALRQQFADLRYLEYQARAPDPALDDTLLRPALRDYLRVRAASPLYFRPHLVLAGHRRHLDRPDAAARYLDRACRLRPADGGLWALAGQAHADAGDLGRACDCWRRSLAAGPGELPRVVAAAVPRVGAAGLVGRVLPPDPDLLAQAAGLLPPADRPPVLARLVGLVDDVSSPPEYVYLRAKALRALDRPADALAAFERAVDRRPDRAEWRVELAGWRLDRGDLAAAAGHVREVLRDHPDHPAARELYERILRAKVEGRSP